jgi:hypothetical protein
MSIARAAGGVMLRKVSERLGAKRKAPVAKATESLLCRGLGIIQDGEEVTELKLQEFASRFDREISDDVFAALRELFQVGSATDLAIDEALLGHGGPAGLDLEAVGVDVVDT